MGKKFTEYAREIVNYLSESFPSLYHGGSDDSQILRKWYRKRIPEHLIKLIIEELPAKDAKNIKLSDIDRAVMERFASYIREEEKTLRREIERERIPERKLEKLAKLIQNILIEIGVDDLSVAERIGKLSELDTFTAEKELYRVEREFYRMLLRSSPHSKECIERSKEQLKKYRFYWPRDSYFTTLKALVKKCLKEKHEIPEFTVVCPH